MKKAVIWKESVEEIGREALSVEFIDNASTIDSWNGMFDKKVAKVEVPQELENIPKHLLEAFFIEETAAVEGSSEHWTNGENTVYDANAIPTLLDEDNNPYIDPSYTYVAAVEEVPAIPAHYELRKKAGADQELRETKINQLRTVRKPLLEEVDHQVNIMEDDGVDANAVRQYRKALRAITDSYKNENGSWKESVDSIDIKSFAWPTKPY